MKPTSPLTHAEAFGNAQGWLEKQKAFKQNLTQQTLDEIASWCDKQSTTKPLNIGWFMSDDLSHFYLNGRNWFLIRDKITDVEPETLNYILTT